MIYITNDNWNNGEILTGSGILVVKASASWCGPCKVYKPIFEEFAEKNTDPEIQFAEVDVDDCEGFIQYAGIRGVPSTMIYNNGRLVSKTAGLIDSEKLAELIAAAKAK